ncbi:hypothetical protein [Streptomyces sp. ST2-7A]|uniref:hypothetical protein n=1 Tax=Streptomyces sp. ST2-7A TaxID=2907214 RepID=UPI001F2D445A|nr:hypothetical protein [Streptomyces sp. ST2-7A]MCE7081153.1 hypothetical protein [Streptomyces sp. ST2-7A]
MDPYTTHRTAERFGWATYLTRFEPDLLRAPAGRRTLTRTDPLLFALIYFRHHLASDETGGHVSFSDFHLELCAAVRQWIRDDLEPAELREAVIAPRESGKSTWCFLILPAWALAHGHRTYVAAFADSGHQAEQHLSSFKQELDDNPLLRADYPDLCTPARRESGTTVADRQDMYVSTSGIAFMARGIDSSTLGTKWRNKRPDLLLFDDIEPDASNYSDYQKDKRLHSVVTTVFAMNLNAAVLIAGTVTMPGSIIHDLVRQITDTGATDLPAWPREENVVVRYFPALVATDDGGERSLWPQRWPLDYLKSIAHTAAFQLNLMNNPRGRQGDYWQHDDFIHATLGVSATRWILEIDPAVTTTGKSDWTGMAVVAYKPPTPPPTDRDMKAPPPVPEHLAALAAAHPRINPRLGMCEVLYAQQVRYAGDRLRAEVLRLLARYPRIRAVRIEVNQGGELWRTVLHNLPPGVKLLVHTQHAPKDVRFTRALNLYQTGRVVHTEQLPRAEDQMTAYPKAAHDDVADAVVSALLYFLEPPRPRRAGRTTTTYSTRGAVT